MPLCHLIDVPNIACHQLNDPRLGPLWIKHRSLSLYSLDRDTLFFLPGNRFMDPRYILHSFKSSKLPKGKPDLVWGVKWAGWGHSAGYNFESILESYPGSTWSPSSCRSHKHKAPRSHCPPPFCLLAPDMSKNPAKSVPVPSHDKGESEDKITTGMALCNARSPK